MPQGHNFLSLKLEKISLNLRGLAQNFVALWATLYFLVFLVQSVPTLPSDLVDISRSLSLLSEGMICVGAGCTGYS